METCSLLCVLCRALLTISLRVAHIKRTVFKLGVWPITGGGALNPIVIIKMRLLSLNVRLCGKNRKLIIMAYKTLQRGKYGNGFFRSRSCAD